MSGSHSLFGVSVDLLVGLDGGSSGSSPLGDSDTSGDLGESVVVGGLLPGVVGGGSSLERVSSSVSPDGLNLLHVVEVSGSSLNSTVPDADDLSGVHPSSVPDVSDVLLVVHDLDGVDEVLSGLEEVLLGHVLVVDGDVVSVSGLLEGLPGVASLGEGLVVLVDGFGVSVDGSLVSGNSSSELGSEHLVEFVTVAGVVVGSEVSEGLVSADGSKSHVLLDELSSGGLSGVEGFLVVEEREVSEVVSGGAGGSDGDGSDDGDLGEHSYFINYSLDSLGLGQCNSAN